MCAPLRRTPRTARHGTRERARWRALERLHIRFASGFSIASVATPMDAFKSIKFMAEVDVSARSRRLLWTGPAYSRHAKPHRNRSDARPHGAKSVNHFYDQVSSMLLSSPSSIRRNVPLYASRNNFKYTSQFRQS